MRMPSDRDLTLRYLNILSYYTMLLLVLQIIRVIKEMKGRQRSMAIRSGINKQGWQKSDFPVACQKCYGENPYVRMLKQDYGQQCRICFRPFTVFKWKGDRGIYKRTSVCQSCSKDKNVCQVCTLDLQFGLPIQVRDRRCGKNGKYLMDSNFTNADSLKIKPAPPAGPPPALRQAGSEKELVYIPEEDSQQEEKGKEKQEEDKSRLRDQKVGEENIEKQAQNGIQKSNEENKNIIENKENEQKVIELPNV